MQFKVDGAPALRARLASKARNRRVFDVLRLRPMLCSVLAGLPVNLCAWLTILAQAVPARSALTFLELLVGAMITDRGFVTEAILSIAPRRRWYTYFKWLEEGQFSWVRIALSLAKLLVANFSPPVWHLVIDDSLIPRASKKAPDVGFHFDHSQKPNRSKFIWGQDWVTLAAVVHAQSVSQSWAVPIISRLVRKAGNRRKVNCARVLLRVVRNTFGPARLLLDTWFMRASVIEDAVADGLTVIGQVRKDLALYRPPSPKLPGQRGRARKFGMKLDQAAVATLGEDSFFTLLYGQGQTVHYRSAIALAKFLAGRPVRAVWIRLEDRSGALKAPRLLICTDTTMTARAVIEAYALRWTIEPMFCSLKNAAGIKEAWQRRRQTLHRWVQILSTAFALTQMVAVHHPAIATKLAVVAPWRKEPHPTAGMVKRGLANLFRNVRLEPLWDRKRRKFATNIDPPQLHSRTEA